MYNNNDQQFNRYDILTKFCLIIWSIDFLMTTYNLNIHVCLIEIISWQWNEVLLYYISVKTRYEHMNDVS